MCKEMILTHGDGIALTVNLGKRHSIDEMGDEPFIDEMGDKPFYEYSFTVYASFDNTSHIDGDVMRIGVNESVALRFKRGEQLIRLLHKIRPGQEIKNDLFIFNNLLRKNTAIVVNTKTLFWQMASDYGDDDSGLPQRDFAGFLERTFALKREIAWRFAWALVRAAYTDNWSWVEKLISDAQDRMNSKNKSKADQDFSTSLEDYIIFLKEEVLS